MICDFCKYSDTCTNITHDNINWCDKFKKKPDLNSNLQAMLTTGIITYFYKDKANG